MIAFRGIAGNAWAVGRHTVAMLDALEPVLRPVLVRIAAKSRVSEHRSAAVPTVRCLTLNACR